jgi:hypothetical protein
MRLRLPSVLRRIADWDMRLQLVAIAAILIAGLLLIVFEHCGSTNDVAASSRKIVGPDPPGARSVAQLYDCLG